MPHLVQQLRSALARISPYSTRFHLTRAPYGSSSRPYDSRVLHNAVAYIESSDSRQTDIRAPLARVSKPVSKYSARVWRRHRRVDHLTIALHKVGKGHRVAGLPAKKPDLTYTNVRSRTGFDEARARQRRHVAGDAREVEISLQSILGRYICSTNGGACGLLDAQSGSAYTPSQLEHAFLHAKGYSLADVAAWADVAAAEDALEAAEKLADRIATHGALATPLFVYMNLLRRQYISARALRVVLQCGQDMFKERARVLTNPGIDNEPRFLAIIRLMRHAREVWPESMSYVAELMLDQLRHQGATGRSLDNKQLAIITYNMNKLLSLISLSTAESPFKNVHHQEAAIIPILRYMAEHQPALQINRQGYRAVIRIQLAQRKTPDEQQWAALKALSWPPWKVDRTAMDAGIVREAHGTSRAGFTLLRMREAGYRPLLWEQIAQVYTGWDLDGTPTIQRRVLLGAPGLRLSGTASEPAAKSYRWAVRIDSTRTIQEAWACYLAWEDRKLPHAQDVYLSIATKLNEEQKRPHIESKRSLGTGNKAWPLFPGDSKEIAPLPPSMHLYTYNRRPPPTTEEFYHELQMKGVVLEAQCLAFFVRHASTLEFGLECLRNSIPRYPEIQGMLSLDPSYSLEKVPISIYVAAVTLLSRFAYVPLGLDNFEDSRTELVTQKSNLLSKPFQWNPDSSIVRAIELLRLRPEPFRPLWHAVFFGLIREHHFKHFANLMRAEDDRASDQTMQELPLDLQQCEGALTAYRLARQTLALQSRNHIDIDAPCFYYFCVSVEHMAVATCTVLQAKTELSQENQHWKQHPEFVRVVDSVKGMFRKSPGRVVLDMLKNEFENLVGCGSAGYREATQKRDTSQARLPRLLSVPAPAMLHRYIRAMGWLADYDGLLQLARWMRTYRIELAQRRKQDRGGEEMMRKAVVALRVFLERSWIVRHSKIPESSETSSSGDHDPLQGESARVRMQNLLTRFRTRAPQDTIDAVREIIQDVEDWKGWPGDDEVEEYAADKRFRGVQSRNVPSQETRSHAVGS